MSAISTSESTAAESGCTILVTGGAGFIGSHLCEKLLLLDYSVVCLDNFNDSYNPSIKRGNIQMMLRRPKFRLAEGDILDAAFVDNIMNQYKISIIVHLAALAGVRGSIRAPLEYVETDISGTVMLLEACGKYGIKKFIYASSSSVYGRAETPFREDDVMGPQISPYAAAKYSGEMFCRTYNQLYGFPVVCLRFFTVYGSRQRPEMAIHSFTKAIDEEREIHIYGDGSSTRDYTYIDDITDGIVASINLQCNYEAINLGSSNAVSVLSLIKMIESKLGKTAKLKFLPDQPGDVPATFADNGKAAALLGYRPKVSLEEGVERFVRWYKRRNRPLKILQIAPDVYPIPPVDYGGTEAVVHEITEELVRRGHEVYLYASDDSKTSAHLIPYRRTERRDRSKEAEYILQTMPEDIDIIHDHTFVTALGRKEFPAPVISTIHGTLRIGAGYAVFVSRRALDVVGGNNGFYVYNGLNLDKYQYSGLKSDYMLFLSRIDSAKGIVHALDIADRTKKKLMIAGPVHDPSYFSQFVEPRIRNNQNIRYVGAVGAQFKQDLLKYASCLLFPTSWEEPFGLVMIEAMACGTPVIALANGAVPEVLKGFPGCVCKNIDEMVALVQSRMLPRPDDLRRYALSRFSTENMVDGYMEVYRNVLDDAANNVPDLRERLRIVQVAPDAIPVPPKDYGGIERVVFDLTEELVRQGHGVYLYASQGSRSSAKLIPYKHNNSDAKAIADFLAATLPENIDLIHDHTHASVIDGLGLHIPVVSTIHDSRKNNAQYPVYLCRKALRDVGGNNGFFAYNGINVTDYEFSRNKGDYLLFMGLLYSHKGVNHAIKVAQRTGKQLIIAGPIYSVDYYRKEIEPHLINNANIRCVGPVGGKQRQNILKYARCMLFPSVWEEPFGLVLIEAMACGTPVLAFGNGAVPEVLFGFPELICRDVDEMIEKVQNQAFPDAHLLREYVENNFSVGKLAENYLKIYRDVLKTRK